MPRLRASYDFGLTTGGYAHVIGRADEQIILHPTIALVARPAVQLHAWQEFIQGYEGFEYETAAYVLNMGLADAMDDLSEEEVLVRSAGQGCYASYLGNYSKLQDIERYMKNIIESGHGSVLEHANYSFFFGGVSRSWSHETVRHRHESPSQLSQRYVDGKALRFVMRPEYIGTPEADLFKGRARNYALEYEALRDRLPGILNLAGLSRTDARKAVNQVAREVLPNCTETTMFLTGNARSWRHFIRMRGSLHAETEIRRTAWWVAMMLKQAAPTLFLDVEIANEHDFEDGWKEGVTVAFAA